MKLDEAKQILNNVGYHVINEREINLNNLVKDIFEVLTSFGISASDDEVERLIWTYINSGRNPENSNAEDILEFDIDNAPDTIIHYTDDFVNWIKSGQYKTGPVDEAKQYLEKNGYQLIKEADAKYTLLDKHLEYDEDTNPYEVVYGPVSLAAMRMFVNQNTTKTFEEIPLNPDPSEEPEEGFIIVSD